MVALLEYSIKKKRYFINEFVLQKSILIFNGHILYYKCNTSIFFKKCNWYRMYRVKDVMMATTAVIIAALVAFSFSVRIIFQDSPLIYVFIMHVYKVR